MGKKIIVLSDGTGNSAGKLFRTNVWRFYQALDVSKKEQIARYDDGVGTSGFKPLALLGGAIGWGLKRNVLDLYTFLCRNYVKGEDTIYGIGFSRGAFTIRVLTRFVLDKGLIQDFNSEDDLRRKARYLYRDFRRQKKTFTRIEGVGRGIRDGAVWIFNWILNRPQLKEIRAKTTEVPKIEFLGVWDTVDAYGMPVFELKRGIDLYLWPLSLDDSELAVDENKQPRIGKACHALAIDDKRRTFHPYLWDERGIPQKQHTDDEVLTQVWFAGMHANVGGGYPDDGLSHVSLQWMVGEAIKQGLRFNRVSLDQIDANVSPLGKMYDSRAGRATYFSYDPRRLDPPRDRQGAEIACPKIHQSVLMRMLYGSDAYAPLSLPTDFRIVGDDEISKKPLKEQQELRPGTSERIAFDKQAQKTSNIVTFEAFNESQQAPEAVKIAKLDEDAKKRPALELPDASTVRLIWATVWWRKVAYWSTLVLTIWLLLFPFVGLDMMFSSESSLYFIAALTWSFLVQLPGNVIHGVFLQPLGFIWPTIEAALKSLLEFGFLPGVAKSWIEAFQKYPREFGLLCFFLLLSFVCGPFIDRRIHDRSYAAWNRDWQGRRSEWFQRVLIGRAVVTAGILFVCAALLHWSFREFSKIAQKYNQIDSCTARFRSGECTLFDEAMWFFIKFGDFPNGVFIPLVWTVFGSIAAIGAIRLIWSVWDIFTQGDAGSGNKEKPGLALRFSDWMLTCPALLAIFKFVTRWFFPAGFAILVAASALIVFCRFGFAFLDWNGYACAIEVKRNIYDQNKKTSEFAFDFRDGCRPLNLVTGSSDRFLVAFVSDKGVVTNGGIPTVNKPEFPEWLEWPFSLVEPLLVRNWSYKLHAPLLRVSISGIRGREYQLSSEPIEIPIEDWNQIQVFLNEAVIGVPRFWNYFYSYNTGSGKIIFERLDKKPDTAN